MSSTSSFCPKCSQPISIGDSVIAKCRFCGALTLSNDVLNNPNNSILDQNIKQKNEIKKAIFVVTGLMAFMIFGLFVITLTVFPVIRFHFLAALGDTNSMKKLSTITHEFKWAEQACAAGDSGSCWAIWNCFQGHDNQKALDYLKKGAVIELKKRESSQCLLELTRVYEYGLLGQAKNPEEAAKYRKQYSKIDEELRARGMIL